MLFRSLLCKSLEDNYNRKHTNRAGQLQYSIRTGRKYHKIVEGEGSAHAFVDKNTGEVYKPSSWSAPAKGVRYDLRLIEDREWLLSHADWCGSYLYSRDVKFAHLK